MEDGSHMNILYGIFHTFKWWDSVVYPQQIQLFKCKDINFTTED